MPTFADFIWSVMIVYVVVNKQNTVRGLAQLAITK